MITIFFKNETKRYIIETYFQAAVIKKRLLKTFSILHIRIKFARHHHILLTEKLDGTMGHHVLIRFTINGKIAYRR